MKSPIPHNKPAESHSYTATVALKRSIIIPVSLSDYQAVVDDFPKFRAMLEDIYASHPELFPPEFEDGFQSKDKRLSLKLQITLRRITVGFGEQVAHYQIVPGDVLAYMTGKTEDLEKPLWLRKYSVPYWVLAEIFGRDANYYHRIECMLGRCSVVGALSSKPGIIPKHFVADEKHAKHLGKKAYIAMAAGGGCVLAAELTPSCDADSLRESYGVLRQEAEWADPDHRFESANTDGFQATVIALQMAFGKRLVLMSCILHLIISIRDGAKKKFREHYEEVADWFWWCYEAETKRGFAQRWKSFMRRAQESSWDEKIKGKLERANEKKLDSYKAYYDNEGSHRVSTALDQLMGMLDRRLFAMRHLHGHFETSRLLIRGWAQIQNFAPWNPRTRKLNGAACPAERLNGFRYRESWLENLRVSTSMGGYRHVPQIPVE